MRNSPETTGRAYRLLLTRCEDAKVPTGRPSAPWHNAVLTTRRERDDAVAHVKKLGLPVAADSSKNWDTLAALDCILSNTSTSAKILDAGAEIYSRILPWLFLYGYTKLEGINIIFTDRKNLGPIIYKHGDVTSTDCAPETFDAIACLSVIEHGVICRPTSKKRRAS